jgi:hypothetical protein
VAAPHTLFEQIADGCTTTPPHSGSAAAVDCRLNHD